MRNITNLDQLKHLISSTYVWAVIVVVVAIAIAILVSFLIPWQGGKDKSYIKRRIAFIIIGIVAALGFWLYNELAVSSHIRGAGFVNMFKACNVKCLAITIGGYCVIGVIIMFCFRHSKFGSILGNKLKK